jgi:hypothetical protein
VWVRFDGVLLFQATSHACLVRQGTRGHFVTHHPQQFRTWPDESDPRPLALLGKIRVLSQKAVSRVNEFHAFFFGECYDPGNIEIRAHRPFARADQVSFISFESMHRQPIFLRVNGDRAQAEFGSSTKNADGDFTAIGH